MISSVGLVCGMKNLLRRRDEENKGCQEMLVLF